MRTTWSGGSQCERGRATKITAAIQLPSAGVARRRALPPVHRASFYDPEINRSYGMMASHTALASFRHGQESRARFGRT
ncbi:hypothetical protein ACVMFA_008897 [Bradyrhizobium liaoningense]